MPQNKKLIENTHDTGRRKLDSSGYTVICPDSITITKSYDRHGGGFSYSFNYRLESKFFGVWIFIPKNQGSADESIEDEKEILERLDLDSTYTSTLFKEPVTWRFYKGGDLGHMGLIRGPFSVTAMASSRAYLIQAADIISTLDRD